MIATGGLLRINARRQDSAKTHKTHTHKRRKKKRKTETVVVKAKLKLCSLSGLVAALGLVVLLVGGVMAALGYWPKEGLLFTAQPQEGTAVASVLSFNFTRPIEQGGERENDLQTLAELDRGDKDGSFNGTNQRWQAYLREFLDRLKVFGPLIMGLGIFLFICANAVLHEKRDRKSKVINLHDVYSTVIDLHSLRPPVHQSSAISLNGLVNYVQLKSLEFKQNTSPTSLEGEVGGRPLLSKPGGNELVFSVCQRTEDSRPLSLSNPPCTPCGHTLQRGFFTLPLRRPPPRTPRRTLSDHDDARSDRKEGRGDGQGPCSFPLPLPFVQKGQSAAPCSLCSLQDEADGDSRANLLSGYTLSPSSSSSSSSKMTITPTRRSRSLSERTYSGLKEQLTTSPELTSSQRSEVVTTPKKERMLSRGDSG
ncbi:transmembrane protein 200C-like isoform X2 [Cynoglossus semilaevis]|uniref:transmembrane protein 200C-like isoform X2 n=1 Tax=Cynoglossus semilaevis TaxID=244447 RepID=UPI0007DCB87B|nr:transmembrane protein 200C-like isoform X2 [Cynoglossus semilaevis]